MQAAAETPPCSTAAISRRVTSSQAPNRLFRVVAPRGPQIRVRVRVWGFKGAHCGRGGRSGVLDGLAGLLGARGADMCCSAAECQIGISLLATPFLRKGGALRGRMMPLGCARTRSYRLYCSYIPIGLFQVQRQNRRYALRDRIAP